MGHFLVRQTPRKVPLEAFNYELTHEVDLIYKWIAHVWHTLFVHGRVSALLVLLIPDLPIEPIY